MALFITLKFLGFVKIILYKQLWQLVAMAIAMYDWNIVQVHGSFVIDMNHGVIST